MSHSEGNRADVTEVCPDGQETARPFLSLRTFEPALKELSTGHSIIEFVENRH